MITAEFPGIGSPFRARALLRMAGVIDLWLHTFADLLVLRSMSAF